MKIIVGLGNPGSQYERTRHNIGFLVVDRLSAIHRILIATKRFKALLGRGLISSQEVLLIKPMTFMNQSGEAVQKALDFFNIAVGDLVVIHDDLDLMLGRLRFKTKGGDGGHLGVRSIIESVGTDRFLRLKVGIGRPPRGVDPAAYVLSSFSPIEKPLLEKVIDQTTDALRVMLSEGLQTAMNRFQKKNRTEEE